MNVGDFVEYWYNTYRITRHAPSTAALAKNYIHVHIQPNLPKKFIHVMFGNHKNPHKIKQK